VKGGRWTPRPIRARFRPDPHAALATLFRMGGDEAIETIAMGDGGWGREQTEELLVRLRETGSFVRSVEWQDLENLTLTSLIGRDRSQAEADAPVAPALASAILIRATGEPICAGNDFGGSEGAVARLISAALVLPTPIAAETASLLAWRLRSPIEPPYGTRCFLWLGLVVLAACEGALGITPGEVAELGRAALDADQTGGDGGLSLALGFRVEGPTWGELVDRARKRIGPDGGDAAAMLRRIVARMGETGE
jgi:hypothetical protein